MCNLDPIPFHSRVSLEPSNIQPKSLIEQTMSVVTWYCRNGIVCYRCAQRDFYNQSRSRPPYLELDKFIPNMNVNLQFKFEPVIVDFSFSSIQVAAYTKNPIALKFQG